MTSPAIEQAAQVVATARLDLEEAQHAQQQAQQQADSLSRRIAERQERQSAITARRLADKDKPADAAEYAALEGDLKALAPLLAESRNQAQGADDLNAKKNALAQAEQALKGAVHTARLHTLAEHARKVESAYVQSLAAVWRTAQDAGLHGRVFGDVYAITPALVNLCRFNVTRGLEEA